MAQTSAGPGPIPPAKKDDSEDVAWALSTAEAMYARGDRGDALKWLRRAAEAASEAEADDRALELAKAAADLASIVGPTASMPPPPPPSMPPPTVRPSASPPPPPTPAPPSSDRAPGARLTGVAGARPSAPPPARLVGQAPLSAARTTLAATHVPPRTPEPRRGGRRSRPNIVITPPPDDPTQTDMALPLAQPRRRRASRPPAEDLTPSASTPIPDDPVPPTAPTPAPPPHTDDMDAWPTQSLVARAPAPDSSVELPDEKTRIGVPAYEASAMMATAPEAPSTPLLEESPLRPAQAVRVVVWRTAEGVCVAPHGTRVTAITVDAMLVALDPDADLAAWLSGK